MNRRAMFVALLAWGVLGAVAAAEEPHERWLKHLAGKWEVPDLGIQVELQASPAGLMGTGSDKQNTKSNWIWGWDAGRKKLSNVWFASDGSLGRVEYTITGNTLSGPAVTTSETAKGNQPGSATISVRMIDANTSEVEWTDVVVAGEKRDSLKFLVRRQK